MATIGTRFFAANSCLTWRPTSKSPGTWCWHSKRERFPKRSVHIWSILRNSGRFLVPAEAAHVYDNRQSKPHAMRRVATMCDLSTEKDTDTPCADVLLQDGETQIKKSLMLPSKARPFNHHFAIRNQETTTSFVTQQVRPKIAGFNPIGFTSLEAGTNTAGAFPSSTTTRFDNRPKSSIHFVDLSVDGYTDDQ